MKDIIRRFIRCDFVTKSGSISMPQKKRMHNPKTKTYLKRRERTTTKGKRGEIMGSYKPKKHNKKKSFWDL